MLWVVFFNFGPKCIFLIRKFCISMATQKKDIKKIIGQLSVPTTGLGWEGYAYVSKCMHRLSWYSGRCEDTNMGVILAK